ncbi:MAG: trigger factor [Candidatus Daviesbacteria bacterium]|nr:trigger factor [Candidatus Daviesbacteria bacterium]
MITKNILKQPKSIVEVSITVPWSDLQSKWDETLQKLSADLEISGFRKGQAPLPMVEQNLGSKLQDEFLKTVMPQFLVESLQGSTIVPIDYPKYQLVSFAKGADLSFKAQITEKPEIKIGDYKTIKAVKPAVKIITDEDVNKLVDDLFKRWKAKSSYAKASADKQSPDQSGQSPQAEGSMSFNQPQPVTQPSGDIPDDNFAKAVGALSLTDLKTKIKADLENEAKYNNELDYEEAILQEVEKITIVELPDILVDDELNRMLVSLQRRVADMGLLLEDYLKGQNKTLESLKAEWKVQAEKNVRMELGLSEVAKSEKVDVTDIDVQAEIDKIQDAKMKAQFEAQEPRLHLKHSLRQIKTLDLLKTLVKTA